MSSSRPSIVIVCALFQLPLVNVKTPSEGVFTIATPVCDETALNLTSLVGCFVNTISNVFVLDPPAASVTVSAVNGFEFPSSVTVKSGLISVIVTPTVTSVTLLKVLSLSASTTETMTFIVLSPSNGSFCVAPCTVTVCALFQLEGVNVSFF